MKAILAKLVRDEQGGEVLEYALIMGLIVVACIAVIGLVGGKVLAKWNSVDTSMQFHRRVLWSVLGVFLPWPDRRKARKARLRAFSISFCNSTERTKPRMHM